MHLRRALLLFAIVLGLAALATAVSQPPRDARQGRQRPAPPTRSEPTARRPNSASPRLQLRLSEQDGPGTRRLPSRRPAELVVEVEQPGLVAVPGLGLIAAADRLTPARFDLWVNRPGSYPVTLTPAGSNEPRRIGVLRVPT